MSTTLQSSYRSTFDIDPYGFHARVSFRPRSCAGQVLARTEIQTVAQPCLRGFLLRSYSPTHVLVGELG